MWKEEKMGKEGNSEKGSKFLLIILLGVISFFISIYLVKDHLEDNEDAFCDVNSHFSCSKVRRSVFSELFNVPVAVFGVLYNVITISLAVRGYIESSTQNPVYASGLFYWSIFGTLFVFYLITAEIILRAICPICTLIHILQFIIVYLAWKIHSSQSQHISFKQTLFTLKYWIFVIAFLNLLPIYYFNVINPPIPEVSAPLLPSPATMQSFAECITSRGWRFYGKAGCIWCEKQKQLLGESMASIDFFDCATNSAFCKELHIHSFPTWIQYSKTSEILDRFDGFATLEELANFSQCSLPDLLEN